MHFELMLLIGFLGMIIYAIFQKPPKRDWKRRTYSSDAEFSWGGVGVTAANSRPSSCNVQSLTGAH
jgi:hypothetical protein